MLCKQKYCKHCIKPVFDLSGKFVYGKCKMSKYVILDSDQDGVSNYDVQPLYCYEYTPRQKDIKY